MTDSGAIPAELTHSGAIPAESNHSGAIPADSGAIPADSGGFRRNYRIPDGICGALKSTGTHHALPKYHMSVHNLTYCIM